MLQNGWAILSLVIEPGGQVGGMTSPAVLGRTDIGNKGAITGLAKEIFMRRVGARYGQTESWTFEPHVAAAVFQDYIRDVGLPVWYHYRLKQVEKNGTTITAIVLQRSGLATGTVAPQGPVRRSLSTVLMKAT